MCNSHRWLSSSVFGLHLLLTGRRPRQESRARKTIFVVAILICAHKAPLIIRVDAGRNLRSTMERDLNTMEDGLCSILTVHLTNLDCLLHGREYEEGHGL